jgi:hypothetical protein
VLETGEPAAHPRDRLKRELRLRDAPPIVVSGVIGSGIFLTPGPADRAFELRSGSTPEYGRYVNSYGEPRRGSGPPPNSLG